MAPGVLFLDLLNPEGKRQYRSTVLVKDATGQTLRVPIEKPINEPGGNMPMWGNNQYTIVGVIVEGKEIPTQTISNLRSSYPNQDGGISLLLVLQLT